MRAFVILVLFALGLSQINAHEQRTCPRGGALVDVGTYHVELVITDKTVEVFVSDANDKPLPATGFKALAILAFSGKSVRAMLHPSPDGAKLIGEASEPLQKRVKGAVQLTGPDGKTSTGRIN